MNIDVFIKYIFWLLNNVSNGNLFLKYKLNVVYLDFIFELLYMNICDVNVYVFFLDIF